MTGYSPSLVIGDDGSPLIAYGGFDVGGTNAWQLYLFDCADAGCVSGTRRVLVATDAVAFAPQAMALRSTGLPVILYQAAGALMLYECTSPDCSAGVEHTLLGGTNIQSAGLVLLSGDRPFIAFSDNTPAGDDYDLGMIQCLDPTCEAMETQSYAAGNAGAQPDVALRSDGSPLVVFHDVGNNTLMLYDVALDSLDNTPPLNPSGLTSPSHAVGEENSDDNSIDVSWSGDATDDLSGVAGYSTLWDQQPSSQPDGVIEQAGDSLAETSPQLDNGEWYFHLSTCDLAGNCASAVHLGPFVLNLPPETEPGDTGGPMNWCIDVVKVHKGIGPEWEIAVANCGEIDLAGVSITSGAETVCAIGDLPVARDRDDPVICTFTGQLGPLTVAFSSGDGSDEGSGDGSSDQRGGAMNWCIDVVKAQKGIGPEWEIAVANCGGVDLAGVSIMSGAETVCAIGDLPVTRDRDNPELCSFVGSIGPLTVRFSSSE
jgi:hypothetical protein